MKKHEMNLMLKIGILACSIALIAVCIYGIIVSGSTANTILCAVVIAVAVSVDGFLLFCTKGIYMDESNKQYRDKIYIKNKPSFIPGGEKFLEVAAIDDIVSKATSVIDRTDAPEHEACPICGKEIVREQTVLFYTTQTMNKSENKYWGDEFGNYVRPAYEENTHVNQNNNAVKIKCAACNFEMTVGWGEKTQKEYDGYYRQMPTKFVRVNGVKLCQASYSKLQKELKRADGIELKP